MSLVLLEVVGSVFLRIHCSVWNYLAMKGRSEQKKHCLVFACEFLYQQYTGSSYFALAPTTKIGFSAVVRNRI